MATAHSSRIVKVELRHTSLGEILSTSSGFTVYEFTRDRSDKNSCVSVSGCSRAWPALQTSGTPTAGAGVKASLLSTTKLPGGARQLTYAGHPLYLYSGDGGPGETGYVGVHAFGGAWDALNAAGHAVW
jgi:predicted lipoprotein with Yx(FWY)xxD motif